MVRRKIVQIDEEKCNGCGLCVPSCAEGAIRIVEGKARLVSDVYCDGLGACLGECPHGAISLAEREAPAFDEEAARQHVARSQPAPQPAPQPAAHGGCPGARVQDFGLPVVALSGRDDSAALHTAGERGGREEAKEPRPSGLRNWPVQLHLVPPNAPFLRDAELLLVASCVPFALADFHERYLQGNPVVIACPKLDNTQPYVEKLAAMFRLASLRSLTVVHMEVPCCTGLVRIAQAARQASGTDVALGEVVISTRGQVLSEGAVAR